MTKKRKINKSSPFSKGLSRQSATEAEGLRGFSGKEQKPKRILMLNYEFPPLEKDGLCKDVNTTTLE
jgi:hypothetical protein